jgi:site-specific DNA-cytosine methylase
MDARWFGVAQRRRRVFIVAARDDAFGGLGADRAAEVLIECAGVCGHLATGRSAGEETPSGARPGVGTFGADVANAIIARHGKGINSTVEPGHIVNPAAHSDGMRKVDGVARRVDDRGELETFGAEVHRTLQARDWKVGVSNQDIGDIEGGHGFIVRASKLRDDDANPIGFDANRYRCIGNGVVAPVAEFIGRRIVAVDAKYWKEANG